MATSRSSVRVGGPVDLAHPPGPEGRGDPVVRERLADQASISPPSRPETRGRHASGRAWMQMDGYTLRMELAGL